MSRNGLFMLIYSLSVVTSLRCYSGHLILFYESAQQGESREILDNALDVCEIDSGSCVKRVFNKSHKFGRAPKLSVDRNCDSDRMFCNKTIEKECRTFDKYGVICCCNNDHLCNEVSLNLSNYLIVISSFCVLYIISFIF